MKLYNLFLNLIIILPAILGTVKASDISKLSKDQARNLLHEANRPGAAYSRTRADQREDGPGSMRRNRRSENSTDQEMTAEKNKNTADTWGVSSVKDGIELANSSVTLVKNLAGAFTWARQWVYLTEQEKENLKQESQGIELAKNMRKVCELKIALNKCVIQNYKEEKNSDGLPCACDEELNKLKEIAIDAREVFDLIASLRQTCKNAQ